MDDTVISYTRPTSRKTPEQLQQHIADVREAYTMLRTAFKHAEGIDHSQRHSTFHKALIAISEQIVHHDEDKMFVRDDHEYDAHDLYTQHHIACWIAHGGVVPLTGFLEHIADHMAVNKARNDVFSIDVSLLEPEHIFGRDDMSLYFNLKSPWVKEAISKAKSNYRSLVMMFLKLRAVEFLPVNWGTSWPLTEDWGQPMVKGLSSGNTTWSKTGESWKYEPTCEIWSLMPIMNSLDYDHMSMLALEIDTANSDDELSPDLNYGDRTLCIRWRNVIDGLEDDHVYHVADLMALLLQTYQDDLNYDWFSEGLLQRVATYAQKDGDSMGEADHG